MPLWVRGERLLSRQSRRTRYCSAGRDGLKMVRQETKGEQELALLLEAIVAFCQRYQVQELALFGSAVGDDFTAASDVDLLVEFEPEAQVGFLTLSRMQRELSALLQREVDLVPKKGLKPLIRRSVLDSAKVLYAA